MPWNQLLYDIRGAKEPGMIYVPTKWGAKEFDSGFDEEVDEN